MTRPQLRVRPVDDSLVRRLTAELRVRPTTARCLFGRGVRDAGSAQAYLAPRLAGLRRPDGLAGFADAVERVARAIVAGDRIGVFGDYDVDGVTTAALLGTFLRQVVAPGHPPPVVRVARRDLGYGFGEADALRFASEGCRLIVTGDCGTSDLAAIAAARAAGCEVVVVDHHTVPDAATAHPASALVNPFRHDSSFPFRGLASVGLMFYLVAAVRTRLEEVGHFKAIARPDVRELLDLVALGTIADLVPLQGENRILARFGLPALAPDVCARTRPGIAALLRLAGVDPARPVDERTVAWKIAPRLNAPGRLGDAEPALRLLMASADEAERCAAALEEANAARRELQDRVLEDALGMIETGGSSGAVVQGDAIVVAGRGWPAGVVGIVAAKLVDLYRRPAFVIAVDPETGIGRGSARSPDGAGCNLYEALASCAPLLVRFGGHAAAAGLTVEEAQIDALRDGLAAAVTAQGAAAHDATALDCDAEVRIGEIDEALCAELGSLAPFGQENGQPLLVARGVRVRSSRRVGDGSHLKLELEDPVHASSWRGAIGFGLGEHDPGLDARVDVAFAPVVSTWNGAKRVELELRSVVPC
jgi:single-stranded-DNA-specific exonuclease